MDSFDVKTDEVGIKESFWNEVSEGRFEKVVVLFFFFSPFFSQFDFFFFY